MVPEIFNTGQEVKKAFYEAKRQQLGKAYSPSPRHNKQETWLAAGEICIELEASPFDFVRAAFMFNNVPGGPFPAQLTGGAARKWYNQYRHHMNADGMPAEEVDNQEVKGMFQHAIMVIMTQRRMRPRDFLLNDYNIRLDVTPAFVRLLTFPKDPLIRERWLRPACEELNSNPHMLAAVKRLGYDVSFMEGYV